MVVGNFVGEIVGKSVGDGVGDVFRLVVCIWLGKSVGNTEEEVVGNMLGTPVR